MLKVVLAQIDIAWEDKEKNKRKCEDFILQALNQQPDLIIFPEMTLTGFSMNVVKTAEASNDSETYTFFDHLAIKYQVAIAFGYTVQEQDKILNRLCIVKDGKKLLGYDKIHPFSYGKESLFFDRGNKVIGTKIKDVYLSAFICYDLRFPEIFRVAAKKNDFIFVIANWPQKRQLHWETLLQARAIENQCYIAGINRTGTGDGIVYSGGSLIVDPYGTIIAQSRSEEEIITAKIDGLLTRQYRTDFPALSDSRDDLYVKLYQNNLVNQ